MRTLSNEILCIISNLTSGTHNALKADMLRITENVESPQVIRLRLDGILTNETYADFEHLLGRLRGDDMKTIVLDMKGVTFLHEGEARKLARIRCARLRMINCSPFIATLLETVARQD